MFRDRPLTWLFIAATIAVDLVLMVMAEGDRGFIFGVQIFFVFGQLSALAIWSVRGQLHRLARASCLVVATGLLTSLISVNGELSKSIFLTLCSGFVGWTVFVTLVGDIIRIRLQRKGESESPPHRWQVPLIEFFGWTTVVAIISFGASHMDLVVFQRLQWDRVIVLFAVPTCMSIFTRRDLSDFRVVEAIALSIAIMFAVIFVPGADDSIVYVVIFQCVYLVLWRLVLSMDAAQSLAIKKPESLPGTAQEPKLFDSQD